MESWSKQPGATQEPTSADEFEAPTEDEDREVSFRRPFASMALGDLITDAAMDLLASDGPARVTLGRVAAELAMRPSTLHFRTGGMAAMLVDLVKTFAWRWNRWATNPYAGRPEALAGLRRAVADEAAAVGYRLAQRLGRRPAVVEVRLAFALALGLRAMLAHGFAELGVDEADAVVDLMMSALRDGGPTPAV